MAKAKTCGSSDNLGFLERFLLFHFTPYARRMRWALAPARLLQWTRLESLLKKIGFFRLLPRSLRQLQAMLPR